MRFKLAILALSCLLLDQRIGLRPSGTAATNGLLHSSDLTWIGAFRLPATGNDETGFYFSADTGAYWAAHGTFLWKHGQKSTYQWLSGHNIPSGYLSEMSIPALKTGPTVSDLNTASVVTTTSDVLDDTTVPWLTPPTAGHIGQIDPCQQTASCSSSDSHDYDSYGGVFIDGAYLILGSFLSYDANNTQNLSIFRSRTDFTTISGHVLGPYAYAGNYYGLGGSGSQGGFWNSNFAAIPSAYQSAFGGNMLASQRTMSILSRESFGPSAAVVDSSVIGVTDPIPLSPVIGYPPNHTTLGNCNDPGCIDAPGATFNGVTEVNGVAWPDNTRSILFVGHRGENFCYGPGNTNVGYTGHAITSLTRSGTTATAVSTSHGLVSGASVTISGATQTNYNGSFVVLVVDADTFTFQVSGSPTTPATGSPVLAFAGYFPNWNPPDYSYPNTIGTPYKTNLSKSSVPVTITRSGSTATVTLANHGYFTEATVTISGAAQSEYNGQVVITVTGADTFTYAISGTPATPATGSPVVSSTAGPFNRCYDPTSADEGGHGYPDNFFVWAYDANDVQALLSSGGAIKPWEVVPYDSWTFTLPFPEANGSHKIGGLMIDNTRSILYVTEKAADNGGSTPLINAFSIASVAAPSPVWALVALGLIGVSTFTKRRQEGE